jgi:hypothetical protein
VKGVLLVLAIACAAATAHADNLTIGVFAPSAPFPTTAARVELASRLGDHLGKALSGTGTGRVYARAGDFVGAVKKGELTAALVDATYLATTGGYTVIASSLRGGTSSQAWQLVVRGAAGKLGDLKGKRVLVPPIGGREQDFVINAMLGGEVARDFFAKIDVAADTASALSALSLAKADAAIVPVGIDLPSGVSTVLALPALATPLLVAYGNVTPAQRAALAEAAASFRGDATIAGFRAGDSDGARSIAKRFAIAPKRGPLAVPAARLVVGDLVEGRTIAIERTPATNFLEKPKK